MEAAQDSVKKILSNDRGNISATITLIIMITGTIGYFMLVSDQVDSEIRTLSSTQATSYLKSDVSESIRKVLRDGSTGLCNPDTGVCLCDTSIGNFLRDTYQDFTLSNAKSEYNLRVQRGSEAYKDFYNAKKGTLNCFFHPERYGNGVEFDLFSISIKRSSNPNLINLSNYLQAEVQIQTVFFGKRHNEKYLLRYRVDAYSMAHFGVIFNSTGSDPLYQIDDGAFVQINGPVLVDQQDRTQSFALSRLTNFGFPLASGSPSKALTYNEPVYIAGPTIAQDDSSLEYLQTSDLRNFFKEGVLLDVFEKRNAQAVPWKLPTNQYNDLFNYDMLAVGRFPLPRVLSGESAHYTSSAGVTHVYSRDKDNAPIPSGIDNFNRSTDGIYSLLYDDKTQLFKSCTSVDVSSGIYNLIVFNNLNTDFTIDFSGNVAATAPPVFCGMIAARNLTIILNNSDDPNVVNHHVVGKLLLSGKLIVKNKGQLIFTDILNIDQDTISPYEIMDDYQNVQVQYYNQKYYSTQNFTLPFFTNAGIYGGTDFTGGADRFWVPRDTKEFFTKDCGGKKCRISPVGSPATSDAILTAHGKELLYEVFSAE